MLFIYSTVKQYHTCAYFRQPNAYYMQGRSQDFSKGGAEVMEAKAL